ncbi:hypothetical protein NIES4071_57490 [Calothrix sp. NIES-4071]|nr:hypothetical protein NIES4071_57490 [Calothrix sp. NIES-4071]BAZ60056.1 hypothetical protein NIES4105_57440 [Calothrix sp. NIES-4105]
MLALAKELTSSGRYTAVMVSAEVGAPYSHDPGAAELAILDSWRARAKFHLPSELQPPAWDEAPPGRRIQAALQAWAQASPKPLVLFIDEIDVLLDRVLLVQIRQYLGKMDKFYSTQKLLCLL